MEARILLVTLMFVGIKKDTVKKSVIVVFVIFWYLQSGDLSNFAEVIHSAHERWLARGV